jgi:hypothetical protein
LGKVGCFEIAGLDLWFNSSDHDPPHFHAEKPGEWGIKVYFLACRPNELAYEIKWPPKGARVPRQTRDQLLEMVLSHKAELFLEWDTKVCRKERK